MSSPDVAGAPRRRRAREPWPRFALRAAAVLALVLGAPAAFFAHYTVHIDPQATPSLGSRVLLVAEDPGYRPAPGEVVAFRVEGGEPFFADGTLMAKRVVAGPGDRIGVEDGQVVNGDGEVLAEVPEELARWAEQRPVAALEAGQWWVRGDSRRSWDSRYWGPIDADQVVGPVRWHL